MHTLSFKLLNVTALTIKHLV